MIQTRLTKLLKIKYPIIQGGMVWVSGGKLAAACSNAGILGVIGAGSMKPALLEQHIKKAMGQTTSPLAVNIPLIYDLAEKQIDIALNEGIRIFITSAGTPKKFTSFLKQNKATVLHVVSSPLLAQKCEDAGVDAVIGEGFEAGGHNGRDELTTMVLIPQIVDNVSIPVIAAGGIIDARGIKASLALGADGVQMGTRFLMSQESSAHINFKKAVLDSNFSSTELVMKNHIPVRLLKNAFYEKIKTIEQNSLNLDEEKRQLIECLGKGRAKRGMLQGDLVEGELEIGQGCSLIEDISTVDEIIKNLREDFSRITV